MTGPVLLVVFLHSVAALFRPGDRLPVTGLPGGCLVWFSGQDFLFGMGGPSTPPSGAISDTLGLHLCCCGNPRMLVPWPVLILACGTAGLVSRLVPYMARCG